VCATGAAVEVVPVREWLVSTLSSISTISATSATKPSALIVSTFFIVLSFSTFSPW
jgi:hypothetical protein